MGGRSVGAGLLVVVLLGSGVAGVARAHHSVASYDRDHPVTITGTLRGFKFANPHSWLYLAVPDGTGGTRSCDLEGATASDLGRRGWGSHTLKAGTTLEVQVAPRRNGVLCGEWMRVLTVDGRAFVEPGIR